MKDMINHKKPMQFSKFGVLTTATATALATLLPMAPSNAQLFGSNTDNAQLFGAKTDIDKDDHIAIAAPFGDNNYKLLVVEQKTDERQCWDEKGSEPVIVEPLLKNFDFTGICGRATDSNGYSIRVDGQDLGQQYNLQVVRQDQQLLLVGRPSLGNDGEQMIIGRTHGLAEGEYLKFDLEPQWEFAKRTYQGKILGHYYFAKTTVDIPFEDAKQDIYVKEIAKAVDRGFISGFEDNTFRPQEQLTREQVVSIAIESLKSIPELNITVPEQVSNSPYPDVATNRWSAAKIQWAKNNDIVSGYPNGTFRPADSVTRAELMAIENKVAQYAQQQLGQSSEQLPQTQEPFNFTDIQGHWANDLITQMSAACGIASPLNEQGDEFAPNEPAQRNYAAAATVRMLNCLEGDQTASLH